MPSKSTAFVTSSGVKDDPEQMVAACVPTTGVGFTVMVKSCDGPFTEIPKPSFTARVFTGPTHGSPKVALLATTLKEPLCPIAAFITVVDVVA